MKKSISNLVQYSSTHLRRFVAFERLFKVSNSLIELDFPSLVQCWHKKASLLVHMILLYLFVGQIGVVLLLLYVDDIVIMHDNFSGIQAFQQFLSQQFEMKDLGFLSHFLVLRCHPIQIDIFFPKLSMYLSYCLVLD